MPWQQNQMGMAYINGQDVERDVVLGRHWIHFAAHQDFPLAQYNLGLMFYDGIGGERNPECAQWWL
nr:hypothetical protein [Providencia rettgeri]